MGLPVSQALSPINYLLVNKNDYSNIFSSSPSLSIEFSQNIADHFDGLTELHYRILNHLLYRADRFGSTFSDTHKYIAAKIGCSVRSVENAVRLFDVWGLINKKQKTTKIENVWRSNLYRIHPMVFTASFREKFLSYFPLLKRVSRTVINAAANQLKKAKCGHARIKENSIILLESYLTRGHAKLQNFNEKMRSFFKKGERRTNVNTKLTYFARFGLKLTKLGEHKLSLFPTEVLQEAEQTLYAKKDAYDPFNYLLKVATKLCTDRNIEIDWNYFYTVALSEKLDRDGPCVEKDTEGLVGRNVPRTQKREAQQHRGASNRYVPADRQRAHSQMLNKAKTVQVTQEQKDNVSAVRNLYAHWEPGKVLKKEDS